VCRTARSSSSGAAYSPIANPVPRCVDPRPHQTNADELDALHTLFGAAVDRRGLREDAAAFVSSGIRRFEQADIQV
jgi:hypothetical protein